MTKAAGPVSHPQLKDTVYQFTADDKDEKPVDLNKYKGHVCIIANTASKVSMGFSPTPKTLQDSFQLPPPFNFQCL